VKHEIFGGTYTDLPTASPASTVTPGIIAAAASTITPTQAATLSPVATASTFASPTPTQPPEEKKEVPGFGAVFAMLGIFAVLYLKSKRGNKENKRCVKRHPL
jgi:hypothetical protein